MTCGKCKHKPDGKSRLCKLWDVSVHADKDACSEADRNGWLRQTTPALRVVRRAG